MSLGASRWIDTATAILGRWLANDGTEDSSQVLHILESCSQCDLFDRKIGVGKKCSGRVNLYSTNLLV